MLSTYVQLGPVYVVVGLCDYSVNWYLELGHGKNIHMCPDYLFLLRGSQDELVLGNFNIFPYM